MGLKGNLMNAVKFPCVVLAGGQSRRMGGSDKFDQVLAGRTLLQHILERLQPQVGEIILNANIPMDGQSFRVIADIEKGQLGPLAGILTGLSYFMPTKGEVTHMVACPCDVPFIPLDFVDQLSEVLRGEEDEIVMASSKGRLHPVVSLWPFSVLEDLHRALLEEDLRKIRVFAKRYNLKEVEWTDEEDPFFNVNTPEDLTLAEARARLLV